MIIFNDTQIDYLAAKLFFVATVQHHETETNEFQIPKPHYKSIAEIKTALEQADSEAALLYDVFENCGAYLDSDLSIIMGLMNNLQ